MEKQEVKPFKKAAYSLVKWQLMVIICLVFILGLFAGMQAGKSALLGGLAYWLPNVFFVSCLFARADLQKPVRFLIILMLGEMAKLFIGALIFILIIKHMSVSVLAVLAGYIVAIISFWIASVIYFSQSQEKL